jgi:uncharacterized membrane protein
MVLAAALWITFSCPTAWSAPPSFQGLGHLPGYDWTQASAVSSDGSVVVGWSQLSGSYNIGGEPFRWTRTDGMHSLGFLPGANLTMDSGASGVSGDGSIVVGNSGNRAFRWSIPDGMRQFHDGGAYGISADGSTVVGSFGAFRWSGDGGRQFLAGYPMGAKAVSADGSVVVGQYFDSARGYRAYRWTSDGGVQDLGLQSLPGGEVNPSAYAVSADGSVVAGWNGRQAFRWSSSQGAQLLGDPRFVSVAMGVSGDGSILVGYSNSDLRAFIWDEANGMRDLQQVLVSDYGLDLTGWTLQRATAISADGSAIVGSGLNPIGETEAWVATIPIPEPSSFALLGLAGIFVFLVLLGCRKRPGSG